MGVSTERWQADAASAAPPAAAGATPRSLSPTARRAFTIWTVVWWSGVVLAGGLFYGGALDFTTSAKASLYGVSIWLNGWLLAYWARSREARSDLDLLHDCLVLWMVSYAITNLAWEIPWVILSPFVFDGLHTLDDLVAQTGYMRSSLPNMYFWVLSAFGSVDLRTVNHDPTFYCVELFAFLNLATTAAFFHLHRKRSPYRYLIPLIGCGEPIAATFIFSFSEVFGGFANMPGGMADTLLALVWTQYQYLVFPLILGGFAFRLLREDLRREAVEKAARA